MYCQGLEVQTTMSNQQQDFVLHVEGEKHLQANQLGVVLQAGRQNSGGLLLSTTLIFSF